MMIRANTFDLSTLDVEAKDQYGEDMTLDESLFEWRLATDKGYAESAAHAHRLVVGTVPLSCITRSDRTRTASRFTKTTQPLAVQVTAKPYLNELYYNGGAPAAVEGASYDLSRIPLLARDQHGNPCAVPSDIEWTLAAANQTDAVIENGHAARCGRQRPGGVLCGRHPRGGLGFCRKDGEEGRRQGRAAPVLKTIAATRRTALSCAG